MAIQTARISKQGKNWIVQVPGGEVFKTEDAEIAMAKLNELNALAESAASAGAPKIQILSLDGKPFEGIATVQATDAEVFKSKDGKVKTEKDLADATGYVLVSRDSKGKVGSAFVGPDFARYTPMTANGLSALRALFIGK